MAHDAVEGAIMIDINNGIHTEMLLLFIQLPICYVAL